MARRILFIAYNYPPLGGLSLPGVQRTLKLVRHLPYEQAHVLTVRPEYYPHYADLNYNLALPVKNEFIHRTRTVDIFALLAKLKNALRRKKTPSTELATESAHDSSSNTEQHNTVWYENKQRSKWQQCKDFLFDVLHYPDDAGAWILPAFFAGRRIVRNHNISVIFATGMPWSSLCVGWLVSKTTGVPLVVDFRDPWIGNIFHLSKGRLLDSIGTKLERKIVQRAQRVFANTDALKAAFRQRYPQLAEDKFVVFPNGYDSADYVTVDSSVVVSSKPHQLVIMHAGFLYGSRDPAPLIEAIKQLGKSSIEVVFCQIGKVELDYDFRARYHTEIAAQQIQLIDQLPFAECLQRMVAADVLVNIQPKTKTQIPSKLYDYLYLNKPILTIAPVQGALGDLISQYQFGAIYAPEDNAGIKQGLQQLCAAKVGIQESLRADYSQREIFNIQHIIKQISTHLSNANL